MSKARYSIEIIGIASICLCCIGYNAVRLGTDTTVVATITDKTIKRSGESDQYMIFTDNEVFVNDYPPSYRDG